MPHRCPLEQAAPFNPSHRGISFCGVRVYWGQQLQAFVGWWVLGTGTSALKFVYWWCLAYLHNTGLQNTDEADVQEPTQLSWQGARPSAMRSRVQVPRRTLTSVDHLAAIPPSPQLWL